MQTFEAAFSGSKTVIPYLTYADPNPELSEALMRAALDAGAQALEIGLPFSDPIADGPVIQSSHWRALSHKPKLNDVFALVKRLRADYEQPLCLMGSVNLVFHYGIDAFFDAAQVAGVSGVILPDLPLEEAEKYEAAAKRTGVALIFLISPLCREDRLDKMVSHASGFIYLISSTGTTGERDSVSDDLKCIVDRIKSQKAIPVAVGFGISRSEHVTRVCDFADGAIVGSALVRRVADAGDDADAAIRSVSEFIRELLV